MSLRRSRIRARPNIGSRPVADGPAKSTAQDEKAREAENISLVTAEAGTSTITATVPQNDSSKSASETQTDDAKPKVPVTPLVRRSRFKPQVKLPPGKSPAGNVASRTLEKPTLEKTPVSEPPAAQTKESLSFSPPVIPTVDTPLRPSHSDTDNSSSTRDVNPPTPRATDTADKATNAADRSAHLASPPPAPKPLTKRGWFPKAKPNFAEAEKRRARLSSFSESEDASTPKRQRTTSIAPSVPDLVDSAQCDEGQADKAPGFEKPSKSAAAATDNLKPKNKRRVSKKLDELVSENRNKFTIRDLIHMNPTRNPMKCYQKDAEAKDVDDDDADSVGSRPSTPSVPQDPSRPPTPGSPPVATDAPDPAAAAAQIAVQEEDEDDPSLAPQVMIGPDGEIILNQTSLVVDNPANKPDATIVEKDVVVENDQYNPAFYYKRKQRGKLWSLKETLKFYVALSTVGTDFSLMCSLFPKRCRADLKRKFKVEEKKHKTLIDRAIVERRELDMSLFEEEEEEEEEEENIPTEEDGSITQAVRKELQRETQDRKDAKASRAKRKAQTKTTKRPKAKKKSHYFEDSDDSEHENLPSEPVVAEATERPDAAAASDSDDTEVVEIAPQSKTRAGRQPKPTKLYEAPAVERRPRRDSLESLSRLTPLVNLTPGATTQGVIEDQETGQRLLLVKSPPPVGTPRPAAAINSNPGTPSDFVHVYLLSPSTHRNAATPEPPATPRDPSATPREPAQNVRIVGSSMTVEVGDKTTTLASPRGSSEIPALPQFVRSPPRPNISPGRNMSPGRHGYNTAASTSSPEGTIVSPPTHDIRTPVLRHTGPAQSQQPSTVIPTMVAMESATPTHRPAARHTASPAVTKVLSRPAIRPTKPVPSPSRQSPSSTYVSEVTHSLASPKSSSPSSHTPTDSHGSPDRAQITTVTNSHTPTDSHVVAGHVRNSPDRAEITTVTTDDGDVLEILIEPELLGLSGLREAGEGGPEGEYSTYDIQVPLSDSQSQDEASEPIITITSDT